MRNYSRFELTALVLGLIGSVITILSAPLILGDLWNLLSKSDESSRPDDAESGHAPSSPRPGVEANEISSLPSSTPSRRPLPREGASLATGLTKLASLSAKGYVTALDFAPSGQLLVAGGGDSVVLKFWDVPNRRRIISLKRDIDFVHSLRFSPDGRHLAIGCRDGSLRIWRFLERVEVARLSAGKERVHALSYNKEGTLLAMGVGGEAKVWSPALNKIVLTIDGVSSLGFIPNSNILATGKPAGLLQLWNTDDRREIGSVNTGLNDIADLAVAVDGGLIAVASRRGAFER